MRHIALKSIPKGMKYAQFLRTEVPSRVKENILFMENLPFIVGCNPYIKNVHQTYVDSFNSLNKFDKIEECNMKEFSGMLDQLLKNHSNTLVSLSQGMRECTPYMKEDQIQVFINKFIEWRIRIRLLVEHHTKNGVLDDVQIEDVANFTIQQLHEPFMMQYGKYPEIRIEGNANLPYVASHVEYMLTELIKNAVVATLQNNEDLRPIQIHISKADDVIIRIRDLGKGIHPNNLKNIYKYSFSTVDHDHVHHMVAQQSGGILAGLGYGLGMTRVYASFFNGNLDVVSLYKHGADVFLRLKPVTELVL